jgi:hypothetical protein
MQSEYALLWPALQLASNALAEGFHVGAHRNHRAVRVVISHGGQDCFVLLLEPVVVVRGGEGNVPEP